MAELVVTIDGVETQHVHLQKERTTVGRRHHNDIALADLSVSGMHCVFEMAGADVWVKDLGSTNGTFVNGRRVERQRLADGDRLSVGVYRVVFLGTPAPTEPAHTAPMRLEELGAPGTNGAMHASLRVLTGPTAGLEVPLVKTVTTFGKAGGCVVAVYHRRDGYYVSVVDGSVQPAFLNGEPLDLNPVPMEDQDVLALDGSRMLFVVG